MLSQRERPALPRPAPPSGHGGLCPPRRAQRRAEATSAKVVIGDFSCRDKRATLRPHWAAKARGEQRMGRRVGGAGAKGRPREPGGAGARVPAPCLRCLPSLRALGGRTLTPGAAGRRGVRREWTDGSGGCLRCALTARRAQDGSRGRLPRPARPCHLVPVQILMLLIDGRRTRKSAFPLL